MGFLDLAAGFLHGFVWREDKLLLDGEGLRKLFHLGLTLQGFVHAIVDAVVGQARIGLRHIVLHDKRLETLACVLGPARFVDVSDHGFLRDRD
jgi:hypothetical protein